MASWKNTTSQRFKDGLGRRIVKQTNYSEGSPQDTYDYRVLGVRPGNGKGDITDFHTKHREFRGRHT